MVSLHAAQCSDLFCPRFNGERSDETVMVVYLSDPSFVIRPGGTERSEKGAGEQVKRCLQIKGNQEDKIPQVNTATIKNLF